MKRTVFAILLSLVCVAGAAAADVNIAVIDMRKVFQDYEKTKEVEKKLQEQADMFREYSLKLSSQIQSMKKEFEKTRDEAQDNFALSEAERENRRLKARELYEQLLVRQAELKNYNQSRAEQIRNVYEKQRNDILDEIRKVVQTRAVLLGYHLVLDRSGSTSNEISSVVYHMPHMDITQVVLEELNKAYRMTQAAAPKKEPEKKAEKQAETKAEQKAEKKTE